MNALVSQPDVVPGLQPPPGVIPNFVDPPSIVPMASIIIGVTLAFMYCFLALRLYTRIWVTHGFGVDDGVADSLTGTQNIFNPNDSCAVSEKLLWAVKGAFSVITDIYLLALPVSFIVTLSIPLKRKIGVCLVFLTGLIAAELNIGVSCGCMPIGFVVLNNLSKSSWNSLVNLVISQRHDHSCSLPVSEKPIIDDNIAEDQLPKPPKVAMVAMEHFVAKIHSSHFGRVYSISTYDEITLIKEDYHVQLRDWPRYGRRPLYNTQNTSFL
ncbi:hypothetical protein AAE478_006906 [Parahypoxylon ruwenzoriense]